MLGKIIKHKDFTDICCEVVEVRKDSVLVSWINLGHQQSWYIGEVQEITIKNKEDWFELANTGIKCYRKGQWRPLDV